jgi:hypothetical protein
MGTFRSVERLLAFACICTRVPDGVFVPVRGVAGKMQDLRLR